MFECNISLKDQIRWTVYGLCGILMPLLLGTVGYTPLPFVLEAITLSFATGLVMGHDLTKPDLLEIDAK